jgi:hypothetical protein
VTSRFIFKAQTTFIQGRNIMNGVMSLQEILHETRRKRECGVVLKLDFKKAYDKVHWGFLIKCFKARGFNDAWCSWIEQILQNGTMSVRVNNKLGPYFQSYKGVRQGDPLCPLLFNFVANSLARMVIRAQSNDRVTSLIDHLIPQGVAIMQYADDKILCLKDDMEMTRNVKLLLYLFEQMSGLRINFEKSEVLLVGGDDNLAVTYAEAFNCQIGAFPIKYLGVPISAGRLHVVDWKKLDVWQGNSLSIEGRFVLIRTILSSTTVYHMYMFLLPKTIIHKMQKIRRRFFW